MANFTVGQGVVTAGEHVYLHIDELSDDEVKGLLAETQAVAEKRDLLGEGAAQVAIAQSVEPPDDQKA